MNLFSEDKICFGKDTVIANKIIQNPSHIKNFICLLTKFYVYRQRCFRKTLNFHELRGLIYNTQNIEKYIAIKMKRLRNTVENERINPC